MLKAVTVHTSLEAIQNNQYLGTWCRKFVASSQVCFLHDGVSKESISKLKIGNWFHVKLCMLSL